MARTRQRKSRREEALGRAVIISAIAPRVSLSMKDADNPDAHLHRQPWLELRGYMLEPIRDVQFDWAYTMPAAEKPCSTA
jgi:hypothetical protein